jgi:protoporphyrinogen oxidase
MIDNNTNKNELCIVGGSLATLVAARERSRKEMQTVIIHSNSHWGGYFGGVEINGRLWDAGMMLYEFTSFRTPAITPSLKDYNPRSRNDVGRFTKIVKAFVSEIQETRCVSAPLMRINGKTLPDLILGNSIASVTKLLNADSIKDDLRSHLCSAQSSEWHARNKNIWNPKSGVSFADISRINHGDVFHETVIRPFAEKVLGGDATEISPAYHRVPWLPLYWPETLLAALNGVINTLPETRFNYPCNASIADMCSCLANEILSSPFVKVIRQNVSSIRNRTGGYEIVMGNGEIIFTQRLAWSQSLKEALVVCDVSVAPFAEKYVPLHLIFMQVPRNYIKHDFSVLHNLDSDTSSYRIFNASNCAGELDTQYVRLVVEVRMTNYEGQTSRGISDAELVQLALSDLVMQDVSREGIIPSFACVKRLPNALLLPTKSSLQKYNFYHSEIQKFFPGMELIGNSAGAFANSLADQIIQGLKCAESGSCTSSLTDGMYRFH